MGEDLKDIIIKVNDGILLRGFVLNTKEWRDKMFKVNGKVVSSKLEVLQELAGYRNEDIENYIKGIKKRIRIMYNKEVEGTVEAVVDFLIEMGEIEEIKE